MRTYGLDANVVIRLLTDDDPEQRRAALKFGAGLGKDYLAFLPLVCVLELDWGAKIEAWLRQGGRGQSSEDASAHAGAYNRES